jgi:hypothetical protein
MESRSGIIPLGSKVNISISTAHTIVGTAAASWTLVCSVVKTLNQKIIHQIVHGTVTHHLDIDIPNNHLPHPTSPNIPRCLRT